MADLAQSLAFEAWAEEARGVDLLNYAAQRTTLRRAGAEWVGPCPSCGGQDRFSISLRKGTWHCRKAKDRGERRKRDVGGEGSREDHESEQEQAMENA